MPWVETLPSGRYRALYRLPNGQKRSAGTYTHKKAAQDAAIEAEGKVKKPGWSDPRAGQTTWGQWYGLWQPTRIIEPQTAESEESMVRVHLMPRWGDVPLAEIKRHDVRAWITEILHENIGTEDNPRTRKSSTARRILTALVSSLSAAVDAELIPGNPAMRIKLPPMPNGREVFLTRNQYATLAEQIENPADRAVLDFLVGTGARFGEMAGLHLHNLDLETGMIIISDTTDGIEVKPYPKGRTRRQVPLMQWVVDYLDVPTPSPCPLRHRHGECCPSGLVFRNERGGPRDDRNFSQRILSPALRKAGLEDLGLHLHDLRHTYASWLVQDGVPLARVATLLGHSKITVTEKYAHFAPPQIDDIRQALRDPRGANMGQAANNSHSPALHATK